MIRRLWLIYWVSLLLGSCVSNHISWQTNANVRKLSLGMSRQQVIAILGQDYLIAFRSEDERRSQIEELVYKSDVGEEYHLRLINGQLKEWRRERLTHYGQKQALP